MDQNLSLISTIALGFSFALFFGFIAERLKIPALVGYLFAGILIGPATPGFVVNMEIASQLSNIGVMLLMFGVGLHFSLDELLAVKKIAIPGAIVQMASATVLGTCLAMYWGWSLEASLILGLSLSCASTVVLLKALEVRGLIGTLNGRIAVGWLIVEDLATIFILVLLPPIVGIIGGATTADESSAVLWQTAGKMSFKVLAFIALMMIVARRALPWILRHIARIGSRELFTLSVVTLAISIAYGAAQLFGVSFALGAFFAGMVMNELEFSHQAAQESLPLRDAFSVLFFVATGMLFDPSVLVSHPFHVLSVILIIVIGKSFAALALVLAFRYPMNTAITVATSLAQIGEFSFILGGLGTTLGLLPPEGMSLILAGAVITIALNSFLFKIFVPIKESQRWQKFKRRLDPLADMPKETEKNKSNKQVILVGYGHVGHRIAAALTQNEIPFVVVEENRERVEELRERNIAAIFGNAADPEVLTKAAIEKATTLVVAAQGILDIRRVVQRARKINPKIEILLHTYSSDETYVLRKELAGTVFLGEEEIAKGIIDCMLKRLVPGAKPKIEKGTV